MTNFEKIINSISNKHVYLQMHNFPDPDALGSSMGLQYLLKLKGIESTICYSGSIDRFNTKKMIDIFNLKIVDIEEIKDMTEQDEVILLDTQKSNGNTCACNGNVIVSIDHHPIFEHYNYLYEDIRENVGACASIIASYFYDNNFEMPKDVASALVYGINVDTAHLTRGVTRLDLEMFYNLYKDADENHLNYLENNTLSIDDLQEYAKAISSIRIHQNVSFAKTGNECSKSLIGVISDFMLNIVDVVFSVVYSVKNEGIRLSVRSDNKNLHAGKIIIEALEGIGTGGGHSIMAGGFVPVENIDSVEKYIKTIEKKIIDAINEASK